LTLVLNKIVGNLNDNYHENLKLYSFNLLIFSHIIEYLREIVYYLIIFEWKLGNLNNLKIIKKFFLLIPNLFLVISVFDCELKNYASVAFAFFCVLVSLNWRLFFQFSYLKLLIIKLYFLSDYLLIVNKIFLTVFLMFLSHFY
jgi:hypothetical protein